MPMRLRKLLGSVAILVFLVGYVAVVATLGDHIPKHWAAQLAYYGLSGLLWGVPLIPLLAWMNRGP